MKLFHGIERNIDRRALAVETLGNLTVGEFRTPVAVLEDEIARPGPALVPRGQRSAEGRSVVAGCGLDEDLAKLGVFADFAVRHAVHRAAAGQAQAGGPCRLAHVVQHVHRHVLEDRLQ